MTRFIPILLVVLLSTSTAYGLTVQFQSTAKVKGVNITLGDIATIDEESEFALALGSQVVTAAPPPGQEMKLISRRVISHLRSTQNLPDSIYWEGSPSVKVVRSSIQVTGNQIETLIANYLEDNSDQLPDAEIRFIPMAKPMPFLLPVGQLSWDVIPSNPAIMGSNRFSIIFKVDGKVRKNMSVRGNLEMIAPVAVTTKTLAKNTIISPDHLTMVKKDISTLSHPCLDPATIIGKRLSRRVKAGKVISVNQVKFPPTIQKGELVRIILLHGGLQLTATGVARSDGLQDQTIQVQNLTSKKIVYCRVASKGIVEVTL